MLQNIKTEPSSPGTLDNSIVIPSHDNEDQAAVQDQQDQQDHSHTPAPASSRVASRPPEDGSQCPTSWLQLLRPRAQAGGSLSPLPSTATGENEPRRASSAPTIDSDDEPLMAKWQKGKRANNDNDQNGETTHGRPPTNSKRQRHNNGTPHGSLSTPAPVSTEPPASSSPAPPNTATYNGLQVVTAPSFQGKRTEVRCRGQMTFEQAKEYGNHGGNCIFQWPLGLGNPFFILVCQQCAHSAKDKGYFWTHPFEGSHKAGLKHFGSHMSEWQILEHSGWHVTDAREHFEEMLHHNSMLADKPDKQAPKPKPKA